MKAEAIQVKRDVQQSDGVFVQRQRVTFRVLPEG
jgi:hypothetical protein